MKKTARILVVDDEDFILQLVRRILETAGYDVATTTDGESVLALVSDYEPDLILLDINLPGITGYQILERIRERYDIPVIMLTAVLEVTSVQHSLGLGADDYIRKPFRPRELLARVQAKLRRSGV